MKIFLLSNIKFLSIVIIIIFWWFFGDLNTHLYTLYKYEVFWSAFASFLASLVLAFIIFVLFRPRVSISPKIAQREDETGETFYSFKFINTSLFSAFDVLIEAYVCYEIGATNNGRGVNVKTKKVNLRRSNWIYMARWRPVVSGTVYAPHCMIVSTKLDVDEDDKNVKNIKKEIESNSNYLEFRVTLKHSFSNLSSTYRKRFNTSDCVEKGKFKFGNSFKIV